MPQLPPQILFDQISAAISKYQEIDRLTGAQFNVFRILKMDSSEVRMHSALIGDLLNPGGSHGQGTVFLDLFINSCSKQAGEIDTSSCRAHIEYNLGPIDGESLKGGRVDIVIRDANDRHIVIENKIFAGDQKNQLLRYYGMAEYVELFYLTLEDKLPEPYSYGSLKKDEHFHCISYRKHIIPWLELCRKEAAVLPILRESLTQYINLIKHLTNQTTNKQMEQEIIDILKANLQASFTIRNNLDATLVRLSKEFCNKLDLHFADTEYIFSYNLDLFTNYTGIWLAKKEWKHVKIGFQFQALRRNLIYGFTCHYLEQNIPINISPELRDAFAIMPGNTSKQDVWWPYKRSFSEGLDNWNNFEAWRAIMNGEMFAQVIQKVAELERLVSSARMSKLMVQEEN
ncbi:PD-(D/E)XK nuclease family protein [Pedobacter sp. Leaf250]|uniref:PDDEXK-like family protein n=1 Tax=Pedobacter sp. Leaf250 TaxID=2876559 RepID=UPI001E4F1BE4|nr:PD-(D/E)XK nuclease family protein [Pedobacter sp. Leaf250]